MADNCIQQVANSGMHYRFYTLDEYLRQQERLGIATIDLFGATPHVWIDAYGASDGKEIRKRIEAYGLHVNTFMPEFSSMRYTLGSMNSLQHKSWEYIKRCFEFATQIETNQVIISASGFLLDWDGNKRWEHLLEILGRLCRLASESDITLQLLNHYADGTDMIRTKDDMNRCLKQLNERQLRPAVDTASLYEAGEKLEEWFSCFGEQISYINLSNTKFDGSRRHWGDGYLNLWEIVDVLRDYNYQGLLGTVYMVRDYLMKPWEADARCREMMRCAWGQESTSSDDGRKAQ